MNRKLPNLNQLRAFEAAARHLSFKAAAEELFVTQAAISHQVKALEEHLGQKLFHRYTRRVALTAVAERYAQHLGAAFDRISASTRELSEVRMSGTLRLSVAPHFGILVIRPRLNRLKTVFPELRVEATMDSAMAVFGQSGVDGAIRYGTGQWKGLFAALITSGEDHPVAATACLGGLAPPLSPKEIAALPLIEEVGRESDWPHWFRAAGHEGPLPADRITAPNRSAALDLAIAGAGAVLADWHLTRADVAQGSLVRLHPQSVAASKSTYAVWPESDQPDPRLLAFVDWLRSDIEAEKEAGVTPLAQP